jgi:Zn finger protein HypA/HybF involved in hydrogenase expression
MNTIPYPKSVVIKCTNCERVVEDVDDDGYCEDCVIEIGITREEAKHDID